MAIIIETCPKCGHDLLNEVICTYPPIPRKSCPSCGWSWEGEREEVIRVPFGGNSLIVDDLVELADYTSLNLTDCDIINSGTITGGTIHIKDWDSVFGTSESSPCDSCSNNTKNGGSGICHCTLGQPKITY